MTPILFGCIICTREDKLARSIQLVPALLSCVPKLCLSMRPCEPTRTLVRNCVGEDKAGRITWPRYKPTDIDTSDSR
jgi:hypothetical protein